MASNVEQYTSNPYTFTVAGEPYRFGDHFIVADINRDGAMDILYRTETDLYAYDHASTGTALWSYAIKIPASCNGSSFGAADVDGDGVVEVVALDSLSRLHVINGLTGVQDTTLDLLTFQGGLGDYRRAGYVAIVNLRGQGDRDVIVQSMDVVKSQEEGNFTNFYINRRLMAINLESSPPDTLWTVNQDRDKNNGIYEGYWGQAHGPFVTADIDNDGRDEVVGGSLIDDDGSIVDISYPTGWVQWEDEGDKDFIDHIDCVAVGDFKPSLPGLEWVVTQEDWYVDGEGEWYWNTTLASSGGLIWEQETSLFSQGVAINDREPQNIAVGNFDTGRSGLEVWNRSRFSDETHAEGFGLHPWVYDNDGVQFSHYDMEELLDGLSGNFSGNNAKGIEMIWTIDWDGSGEEYIVGKARHGFGHLGIFDATDGTPVWTTLSDLDTAQVKSFIVADISGDSREELILWDLEDNTIKIYHNDDPFTDTQPNKWDDPLYRRLKQNWSYYSPGSYTQRTPLQKEIRVFLEGPYAGGDTMRTSLLDNGYIPLASPYEEDPRVAVEIPDEVVDWVLVELRTAADGDAVAYRSAFLRRDGYVVMENGHSELDFFLDPANFYIVIRHRNHLAVMSASANAFSTTSTLYDFTGSSDQFYGSGGCVEVGDGNWGMIAGDGNGNGPVQPNDKIDFWWPKTGMSGYHSGDFNLNGQIQPNDKNDFWFHNAGKGTQIPSN